MSRLASFILALVAAHSYAINGLADAESGSGRVEAVLESEIGTPVSEWYLSLKTSKGYCGLVPATVPAGGYGLAISCNNKYPQYSSSFAVLVPDNRVSDTERAVDSTTTTTEAATAAATGGLKGADSISSLRDASTPIVVPSGTSVRLLARSAGFCNTPPVPLTDSDAAPLSSALSSGWLAVPASDSRSYLGKALVRHVVSTVQSWFERLLCTVVAVAAAVEKCSAEPRDTKDLSGNTGDSSICGGDCSGDRLLCRWWREGCSHRSAAVVVGRGQAVGDAPARAVICALGQPSTLSYKIFKTDLKDGESVDLDKEWVYLMEGDKYCTTTDVAGLSTVISCHLDSPGWYGYKFQLQRMSYPRSLLRSLLTGSPCGVRQPDLPGPHDVECQGGQQVGRAPELDVVLQTPGSPLAAGVVVGFSTFSPGLMSSEIQRCRAQTASPHILLCESPPPGLVASECWFQLYDVKIAVPALEPVPSEEVDVAPVAAAVDVEIGALPGDSLSVAASDAGAVPTTTTTTSFLHSFLRALQREMSFSDSHPDVLDSWADSSSSGGFTQVSSDRPHGTFAPGLGRFAWRVSRFLLPRIELVPKAAAMGPEAEWWRSLAVLEGKESDEGVRRPRRRRLLGSEQDLDPDSGPNPQPTRELSLPDGDAGSSGSDKHERGPAHAHAGQQSGVTDMVGGPYSKWPWPRAFWARFLGACGGSGVASVELATAAPLSDGSLVMIYSRAFSRYCSVSLDGTLLCVSAQASNASRNLFTLVMPAEVTGSGASAAVKEGEKQEEELEMGE